ncbi:hypothetical protein Hanom_Chr12g01133731 [Helianthus anomalus]
MLIMIHRLASCLAAFSADGKFLASTQRIKTVIDAYQAELSNGTEEKNHRDVMRLADDVFERDDLKKVLEVDPKECRVFGRECGTVCENQTEEAVDSDNEKAFVRDENLNEKYENEVANVDGGDEIGGYKNSDGIWGLSTET